MSDTPALPPSSSTAQSDAVAQSIIASLGQGGSPDELKPVGGFFQNKPPQTSQGRPNIAAFDAAVERGTHLTQPYTANDIGRNWYSLPTEVRARLQQEMVAIGLLNPDPTRANFFVGDGSLDESTKDALKQIFSLANANGERWDRAYSRFIGMYQSGMSRVGGPGGSGGGASAPTYLPPDPATLRKNVRQAIQSTLGRDPQAQELQELSDELGSLARQQFDAAVAGGQQVDPAARFDELIQSKYATELDIINQRQEATAGQQRASQSVSLVDRMVSSGMQGGI